MEGLQPPSGNKFQKAAAPAKNQQRTVKHKIAEHRNIPKPDDSQPTKQATGELRAKHTFSIRKGLKKIGQVAFAALQTLGNALFRAGLAVSTAFGFNKRTSLKDVRVYTGEEAEKAIKEGKAVVLLSRDGQHCLDTDDLVQLLPRNLRRKYSKDVLLRLLFMQKPAPITIKIMQNYLDTINDLNLNESIKNISLYKILEQDGAVQYVQEEFLKIKSNFKNSLKKEESLTKETIEKSREEIVDPKQELEEKLKEKQATQSNQNPRFTTGEDIPRKILVDFERTTCVNSLYPGFYDEKLKDCENSVIEQIKSSPKSEQIPDQNRNKAAQIAMMAATQDFEIIPSTAIQSAFFKSGIPDNFKENYDEQLVVASVGGAQRTTKTRVEDTTLHIEARDSWMVVLCQQKIPGIEISYKRKYTVDLLTLEMTTKPIEYEVVC